ncbi:MAG: cadmium-translocating P-type ATPase [Candidatus Omnitrophica bacterium]|nr:cadmium-translocating P-type ATPase [Candidatus Omnitrophota bacterium]
MTKIITACWKNRNRIIAAASILLIFIYLLLHFVLRMDKPLCEAPLKGLLILCGLPLLFELVEKIWQREFSSDFLAGISIIAAFILHEYLAGAIVVFMLSGGRALEDFALRNASSVLRALAKRMPSVAHCRKGKEVVEISIQSIAIGDILIIFPHEICPVDGTVTEGHGLMDESYLTGEPFHIDKTPGSAVMSGAINGDTALTIQASKLPADSRYAKIVEVLKTSEQNKPHIRRLADQLGSYYTPLALAIAGLAWAFSGDPIRFLAVLMVATPCPLLIGIPVAVIGSISLAAKRGIVIKNPNILEQIENCTVAIFDKTGTLTYGQPQLSETLCAPGFTENEALSLAATLERYSKHPLAHAILEAAQQKKIPVLDASEIHEVPGEGLKGMVSGRSVQVTGRNVLAKSSFPGSEFIPPTTAGLECAILIDGKYAALFRFRDTPRPDGLAFIQHLSPKHDLDRAIIISGDRESEVRYLADKVGITEIYAEKSPEEKLALVKAETLKAKTLYVGDGINDAPALMAATVGIAIGRNSDITSESAGAVVLDSSLEKIDELMHISRRMRMIALQSAVGGIILSLIGVVFAATGQLSPVCGALLQEGIDLLSIANALRAALPPKTLTDY